MNTFLFCRYGIQMSFFFSLVYSKSTNIENRLKIRPIFYSSQPIRSQMFFRASDNDDYNPTRQRKILIVCDDMVVDIKTSKEFQALIKKLFIRCIKVNISLVFITPSYFSVPKDVRLNSIHYLIMETKNKKITTKYCNKSFCRY